MRGRNSDNSRLRAVLGWEPKTPLRDGLEVTYRWIEDELRKSGAAGAGAGLCFRLNTAPRANVLGVGVSAINMKEALLRAEHRLRDRQKGYICVTGVHGIMEAQRDPALREILNRSFLCLPDGMPTVWVGRLQGHRDMGRVYGPDFMWQMCRRSAQSRLSAFPLRRQCRRRGDAATAA